jgi:RNA recognition motif-containing protein
VFRLITYASLAAAETAIEALNGTELNNRRVHVRIDDNRQVTHLARRGTPDPTRRT